MSHISSFMMQEIGSEFFVSFKKLQNTGKYIIKSCKIRKDILSLLANQIQTEILNTDRV